ncbi:MAG: IS200/IS605 family transposase [Ignavibacteria bacterium]|nr:IS200/IS605 family transposase [Ignavibacteria bacterium]
MGYLKIWVHMVWTTKNREKVINKVLLQEICKHIRENAKAKGIYIVFINGHLNHIHCLISLGAGQTIDKIAMLLKGESSYWINKNNLVRGKFEWQDEYYAASVSESAIDIVRDYIKNQETHHQKNLSQKDFDAFIEEYKSKLGLE